MTRRDRPSPRRRLGPAAGRHEFDQIRRLAHQFFGLDLKPGKEELVSARLGKLVRAAASGPSRITTATSSPTAPARLGEHDRRAHHQPYVLSARGRPFRRSCGAKSCHSSLQRHRRGLERRLLDGRRGMDPRLRARAMPSGRAVFISRRATSRCARSASPQRGEYPAERCAGLPAPWLARHFETADRGASYRVSAELRAAASFRRLNLVGAYRWPRPFPVIFCRNVMIYFDAATQEKW